MNVLNTIREQRTITAEQWSEIEKIAAIGRIKNQIADLLQASPELDITETFDFIMSLTERELKKRK